MVCTDDVVRRLLVPDHLQLFAGDMVKTGFTPCRGRRYHRWRVPPCRPRDGSDFPWEEEEEPEKEPEWELEPGWRWRDLKIQRQ